MNIYEVRLGQKAPSANQRVRFESRDRTVYVNKQTKAHGCTQSRFLFFFRYEKENHAEVMSMAKVEFWKIGQVEPKLWTKM